MLARDAAVFIVLLTIKGKLNKLCIVNTFVSTSVEAPFEKRGHWKEDGRERGDGTVRLVFGKAKEN